MPLTCWSNSNNPDTVTLQASENKEIKYVACNNGIIHHHHGEDIREIDVESQILVIHNIIVLPAT